MRAGFPFALRLMPSLADFAFLAPPAFLFLRMNGARALLADGDTGWHIRTGEWILANGRVPDRDLFSFTRPGESWFAWEWLWDVLFAWLHRHAGMEAVVLACILVLSATFALLFRLAWRAGGNVLVAAALTMVAAAGSSIHWLARPHLFTLLFLVLFYSQLEKARQGQPLRLIALPALMLLWTNLHGGFFVGLLMIAAYAAGELAEALVRPGPEERRAALARSVPYLAAGAACVLATFANPYSWRLHAHLARYLRESYHFRNIEEFLSVSFQHPLAVYFEPLLLLGMAAGLWHLCRGRLTYAILIAGWTHLGLMSARNLPLFLIVAAPVIAAAMQEWLALLAGANVAGWLRRAARGIGNAAYSAAMVERVPRLHLASIAALAAIASALYAPAAPSKFRASYDPSRYPEAALHLLRAPEFARSVFTTDDWGDYLIYRLHPGVQVFIDGRSDFYGPTFGERYLDVLKVRDGWEENLRRYGVDTVLLPVDTALAGALKQSARWRPVHQDGTAIVFRTRDRAIAETATSDRTIGKTVQWSEL
jgi:hypothetical protein